MTLDQHDKDYRDEYIHCEECFGGLMKKNNQPYLYWTGKEMISIPNFPARQCDVCGWRKYDPQAVYRFHRIYGRPDEGSVGPHRGGTSDLLRPYRQMPD